ncbi:DUF3885 domain-containing protein [Clostridium saccharobutylicum]|uniref:DUF3885 domain-containing protein n=1 Tax=Clostridium saccharobutylicum TaxID=169679 RepID=A0A1S8NDV6_CLOSA|nr:DUF3885 domain-containing protein [Clostridium saccharobutylicum]OOM14583.1 hypothetical protein CLOSAC_14630 [Clostridium saccharobutylicum]
MSLHINSLINQYCNKAKKCVSFELLSGESPYYNVNYLENEKLQLRQEYIDSCLKSAQTIWKRCNFSSELIVLYEDKYSCSHKKEKEFIEKCLESLKCLVFHFQWNDDGEKFNGTRYIWNTDRINIKRLFRKIILSDIGECTELDCAVYIIDNQTKNVFFLYDDRGVDVYSDNENFIQRMKSYNDLCQF